MPKRGGLGQRGLDLLISASPGSTDSSDTEKSTSAAGKASAKKSSKSSSKSSKTKSASASVKKAAKSGSKSASASKSATVSKRGVRKSTESDTAELNIEASTQDAYAYTDNASIAPTPAVQTDKQNVESVSNEPLEVSIDLIEPNRSQPRKNFDEDSLQELADSIRQFGVIQPLIVQKKDDYYEIIAGERRWRASRIAGLKKLPVIVKDYTAKEVMEISLIENIQREDLNPIEEAAAYKKLMEEYGLHQDEVAQRVSRSRAAIANAVRLLNLDQRVQDMVVSEMISTGHARALLALTDPELQYSTAQKVFDEKMSVREVEKLVRRLLDGPRPEKKPAVSETLLTVYAGMEEAMKSSLGTKVSISPKNAQKGKIEIEYYSSDELDRLCELLKMAQSDIRG